MARGDLKTFVVPLCEKMAAEMGFELIDAELVKENTGYYLRIYLDKEGGFTLDDCERFHRAVQPRLEKVAYDFLEVSSPGVDRPLSADRDFERAIGTEIEIKLYKPLDGIKQLTGALIAFDKETIRISTPAGEKALIRKDVALVKPVIVFDDDEDEGEGPNEQGSH